MPKKTPTDSKLSDAEALHGILDAVPHPIFVKDEHSRFVIVNAAMCEFMGRQLDELVGRGDEEFVPREQAEIYLENDREVLRSGVTNENEEPFSDMDGHVRTIVTRKKRILLSNGEPLLIGCITDISDFRRAEAAIRHNAEHDHLTGVANRFLFKKQLDCVVDAPGREGQTAALLLIDLDGFKDVNDVLGHGAGDNVLVQAANRLSKTVGGPEGVARIGGDEFAIIQPPSPQPEAATALAERAIASISKPTFVGRRRLAITGSIGIAFVADSPGDGEALLRRADIALYAAKRDGRNRWRVFDDALSAESAAA